MIVGHDNLMMVIGSEKHVYRPATDSMEDGVRIRHTFRLMNMELQDYAHDVFPSQFNADNFWDKVFLPSIQEGFYGVMIAEECLETGPNKFVGAIFVCPQTGWVKLNKKTAIDWGCYVMPSHRGRGIATFLRKTAFENMKKQGFEVIVSKVMAKNIAGLKSYQSAGAKIVGYEMEVEL